MTLGANPTSPPPPIKRSSYEPWLPPSDALSQAYYALVPPIEYYSSLWQQTLRPFLLQRLGYDPNVSPQGDPTWGRRHLPRSTHEEAIRQDDRFKITDGRVYWRNLDGSKRPLGAAASGIAGVGVETDAGGGSDEDAKDPNVWVSYQIWELADEAAVKDRNADFVFCHGINDYGGKFSEHALAFLLAGYRLILPDLPYHGRSTGLHAYVRELSELPKAVRSVLAHVRRDEDQGRKLLMAGASMGGWTALSYALRYADAAEGSKVQGKVVSKRREDGVRNLNGVMLLCPMLGLAKTSRPHIIAEYAGRLINLIGFTRYPMFEANRGKSSFDPRIDAEFLADPQTYHGKLRVGTALGCLEAMDWSDALVKSGEANARLGRMQWRVIHGTSDRVTNWMGSVQLAGGPEKVEQAEREGKLQLYEGYEHVMLRVGDDEKDDEARQVIIRDMLSFFDKCCKAP